MLSQVLTVIIISKKELVLKLFGHFSLNMRIIRRRNSMTENSEHLLKIRDLIVMNECICYFVALFIILVGMDRSAHGQTTNHVSFYKFNFQVYSN